MPFNIYTSVDSLIIGSDWPIEWESEKSDGKETPRVRYLYFRDRFFRSALQKGERKRGACMPLISRSILVAIGSDRPKRGKEK